MDAIEKHMARFMQAQARAAFWRDAAALISRLPAKAEIELGDGWFKYTVGGTTTYVCSPAPGAVGPLKGLRPGDQICTLAEGELSEPEEYG